MTALADPPEITGTPLGELADDEIEAQGWKRDGSGKWRTGRLGARGSVYRRGNETPEEAQLRDQAEQAKDTPPKGKKKPAPTKPPAQTRTDLKQLEYELAEVLKLPGQFCMMAGDEVPAEHFATHGPILARKLVRASETNPWLRGKLEALAAGDQALSSLVTALGLAGALISYTALPLVYYLNPPFIPREADEMLGLPYRKEDRDAAEAAQAAASAGPPGTPGPAATAGPPRS